MTKEEAKKSLQHTKVYVAGKSEEIQEKLFELGFHWRIAPKNAQATDRPFLYMGSEALACGYDMNAFYNFLDEEVTADYILGLTWEEDKPQYQFRPFNKILVRDYDNDIWRAALFSHKEGDRFMTTGTYFDQCIPYEGNEDLVGTTNKPKEK